MGKSLRDRGKVGAGFCLTVALDFGYHHAALRQLALRPFPHFLWRRSNVRQKHPASIAASRLAAQLKIQGRYWYTGAIRHGLVGGQTVRRSSGSPTNYPSAGKECVVSDTVTTVAPAERITPEMIEAGALEFAQYDPRFESDEEAVVRIYWAMLSAKTRLRALVRSSTGSAPAGAICI